MSGKSRRVYGRQGDEIPPARSEVYEVPRVQTRVGASGGMVRNANGKFDDVIPGFDGDLTCKEVEGHLVELARERGVPADERHIRLEEVTHGG